MKLLTDCRRHKELFIMALPALILFIMFKYLPMFGVALAFKKYSYAKGFFGSPWIAFDNFKFLFASTDSWLITKNTLLYNAVFIINGIIFPVLLSIILSELNQKRLAKKLQVIYIMPFFLSWVVLSFIVYSFLNNERGVINNILISLGFERIIWYSEARYWPLILIISQAWKSIGYTSIIYFSCIVGINKDYYEAAMIDGANKFQQTLRITLPFLKPMIIILTILNIGRIFFADFGLFYQVPRNMGPLFSTTNVIDTYVYRALKYMGNIGMSAAANLYQSFVGFVLVMVSNFIVKRISSEHALF